MTVTASKKAKAEGLKNLKQVSELTKKPCSTLNNWSRDSPELFEIVLLGCVEKLNLDPKGEE